MELIGLTRLNSETNELPLGQRISRYIGQSQINGIVICTSVTLLLIFGVQTPDLLSSDTVSCLRTPCKQEPHQEGRERLCVPPSRGRHVSPYSSVM